MTREQMIETLLPALASSGEALASARRRLWRTPTSALERELLMRGLIAYDDPVPVENEDYAAESDCGGYALGWAQAPLYQD